ncbi:hypothetical protein VSQ99_18360 [Nocardiopsis alba]
MSDEAITELRGDEERTGPGWQRLAKAVVDNPYPGMDPKPNPNGKIRPKALKIGEAAKPAMKDGIDFATKGGNLKEYAYRYEYFKAVFEAEREEVNKEHEGKSTPLPQKLTEAHSRTTRPENNVQKKLKKDIKTIEKMRKGGPVYIDPNEDREKIIILVREQADRIGMGDNLSAAYHARKHVHELPEHERENEQKQHPDKNVAQEKENEGEDRDESGPVKDYLNSLAKTLKEGEVTGFERTQDGQGVHLTFKRIVEKARGSTGAGSTPNSPGEGTEEKSTTLVSHLYIRDHTGAQVATYGRGSKDDRELE